MGLELLVINLHRQFHVEEDRLQDRSGHAGHLVRLAAEAMRQQRDDADQDEAIAAHVPGRFQPDSFVGQTDSAHLFLITCIEAAAEQQAPVVPLGFFQTR